MNIAVFVFAYPVLSETFVINELYQLQEAGVRGAIWREKVGDGEAHPKVGELGFPVFTVPQKIFGAKFFKLLEQHVRWITSHPMRYLKLLIEVVQFFPDSESLKIFIKAVVPAREVEQRQVEIIYVHESDRSFVFGLCAARLNEVPLIVIFHTYFLFVKKDYVASKVLSADSVILQSEYSAKVVTQRMGRHTAAREKLFVISSPGIDTSFFSPPEKARTPTKHIKILSIGRLEEAKGFEFLLIAIHLLKEKNIHVTCHIIGEGSYRVKLEKLRKQFALEDQVTLLGALPHGSALQKELQTADLFVLPSVQDSEGVHDVHPNAVKEAMASGLPVITTRLGGIDEVIDDGVDGFLIETAGPPDIAEKIEEVTQLSISARKKVGIHARNKILTHFDAMGVTTQLLKVFTTYVS